MPKKLQVKMHLRNKTLYESVGVSSLSRDWKRKLFYQHALQQQLKNALKENPTFIKDTICLSAVFICFTLAIAASLGFIYPEHWHWLDNISRIVKYNYPPIGLKEILIFVIVVNGLTFIIRKRSFFI